MKNLLKNFAFIFTLFVLQGCDKNEIESKDDFKIEFGSVCGWCAGEEFITVTSVQIEYYRNIPCGENKGKLQKSRKTSDAEWNEIISSFDSRKFKTLNYNSCNVCADGCDEIIRITNNRNTHEIRYTPSEEIQETKNLSLILTGLLAEMRKNN